MGHAAGAERRGDLDAAASLLNQAARAETNNAPNLCALARCYCRLAFLTNAAAVQKSLLQRALACSLQAVKVASNNAEAHACVAVSYAKSCAYADLKTQLAYSRLFKDEAERAIALDPKQDIAYYLLGRWNYAIANAGLLSRAYVRLIYGGLPKASNEEAIKCYKKAIELAPRRIIHHAGLAMAYAAAGQRDREIAQLQICRDLAPVDAEDVDARREAIKKLNTLAR